MRAEAVSRIGCLVTQGGRCRLHTLLSTVVGLTLTVNGSDLLPSSIRLPAPSVVSLYPSSAAASGAGFTLTVNGSNFLPGSTVEWNGSLGQPPLATTYVNATQLTVAIPASDIAFAGNANVTVVNPAPGSGTSRAATFTITGTLPGDVSFVAPNGNDLNPGTISEPYLTIQRCASIISSASTCAIRAGTYRETVTPKSGITITSYNGEPVTVDGSDPVTGWTLYQGSIYQAGVALSSGDTNQVFAGNQMMTEARWPNGNDLYHVNWATLGTGTTTTQVVDPNLPNINWTGAKIHILSGSDPFSPETGTITASSPGQLTFTLDDVDYPPYIVPQSGGNYYLYRSLGALDAPNEWYYDPTSSVLYFWAPGGVNPDTLNVLAKQRAYAFDLSGRSNVTIENVSLFACAINMDSNSANNTLNGISAQYVFQFTDIPSQSELESGAAEWGWQDYNWEGIVLNGYIDDGGAGFVVQQNVAWNNQYYNIFVHGQGSPNANDNTVQDNTIPDVNSYGYIWLQDIPNCGTTLITNNLILVPVTQNGASCTVTQNGSTAPGATQMTSSVQVGCNFTGCSSEGPPAISGSSVAASIALQPYNMTVTFGQPVTFTVTGAGSPPLTYQWQRDGANITGATSATYTIPKTAAADNGEVFTVTVTNSLGSVTTNPATLTVQDDSGGRARFFP
jgi:hypothetical protein